MQFTALPVLLCKSDRFPVVILPCAKFANSLPDIERSFFAKTDGLLVDSHVKHEYSADSELMAKITLVCNLDISPCQV
jgi:hypothetical protein